MTNKNSQERVKITLDGGINLHKCFSQDIELVCNDNKGTSGQILQDEDADLSFWS